jgi:hypothetical protein
MMQSNCSKGISQNAKPGWIQAKPGGARPQFRNAPPRNGPTGPFSTRVHAEALAIETQTELAGFQPGAWIKGLLFRWPRRDFGRWFAYNDRQRITLIRKAVSG